MTRLAYLPWLIMQPSVASTTHFYEFLYEPLALLRSDFFVKTFFLVILIKGKEFWNKMTHIHLTAIIIAYHDEN
jgi:hypothetical protein